jgi:hypothetical protein
MTKKYSECVYSAFISYAHADDAANYKWISHFRRELQQKLNGDLARTSGGAKPSHLSQENGPIKGGLADELLRRIEHSFALIVIAGDNYSGSEWCVEELEFFKQLFGELGLRQRLYMLAIRNDVMVRVQANPDWQKLALPDQVWIPCYDDQNDAVSPYMENGALTPGFVSILSKVSKDLVSNIKESVTARVPPTIQKTELVCESNPVEQTDTVKEQPTAPLQSAPVLQQVSPPARADSVHIYIESNPLELNEWKPLGRRLAELWKDVNKEVQIEPPVKIRFRGLPVEEIDSRSNRLDDADGVVLLWGKKDSHALRKSIDKVEDLLPDTDAFAPGIVACLTPPQQAGQPRSALGWSVVGFQNRDTEMLEEAGGSAQLKGFLRGILEKRAAA